MYEAELGISYDSLPNYCIMGSLKTAKAEHAYLVRVTSRIQEGNKLRHLLEVRGEKPENIFDVLATPNMRASFHPISRTSYLGVVETPFCPLYKILSSTTCFLISESAQKNHLVWDVIGESSSTLNGLTRKLRREGIDVEVMRMQKVNGDRNLSDKQEQVLKQAYKSGFFENPHKISVRQLAKVLDCSPSTLDRILRKAEKKVLKEKFGVDEGS